MVRPRCCALKACCILGSETVSPDSNVTCHPPLPFPSLPGIAHPASAQRAALVCKHSAGCWASPKMLPCCSQQFPSSRRSTSACCALEGPRCHSPPSPCHIPQGTFKRWAWPPPGAGCGGAARHGSPPLHQRLLVQNEQTAQAPEGQRRSPCYQEAAQLLNRLTLPLRERGRRAGLAEGQVPVFSHHPELTSLCKDGGERGVINFFTKHLRI